MLRIGVTAAFSLVFLLHKKNFLLSRDEEKIWTGLSLFAPFGVIALILGFLPTLVDRLALYLLPIQLFVGSRLPDHMFLELMVRTESLACRFLVSVSLFMVKLC